MRNKIGRIAVEMVVAAALLAGPVARAAMEFVNVGNPGNPADASTGYGSVGYDYQIAKYEVTLTQYTEFLNAVAATDSYSLYNTSMATDLNIAGIARSGVPGSYAYSVIGSGLHPVTYVSWFDAARFTNWLQNGQPTGAQAAGTTETGAYTLNGATSGIITRNAGWTYGLPSENEWYKAAYYQPFALGGDTDSYWLYPTQSNDTPGNVVGPLLNQVNYYTADSAPNGLLSVTQQNTADPNQNYLTPVGAFTNSGSAYGTFDQAGNVSEFMDEAGVLRGGQWWANNSGATLQLSSYGRNIGNAETSERYNVGFRVASIPEPSSTLLLVLSVLGLMARRRR